MSNTIYSTPDEWGSQTVYADESGMNEVVSSLIAAGGEDWAEINLSDCAEWELVQTINNISLYKEQHVKGEHYIALAPGSNGEWMEVHFSGFFGRRLAVYDDLDEAIEELTTQTA